MNTNCNTNLPVDAISVVNVVPGMRIRAAYSGEVGTVKRATSLGNRTLITFEDHSPMWASNAGTFRYVNSPVGYNYHDGHGCRHDW